MSVAEQPVNATPPPADGPPTGAWWERLRRWLREPKPQFSVGTLRYTGFGMLMVFVWLLWGDFCFTLLDQNIPNILPLELHSLGASDTTNSVLNGTLSYIVTLFLAPVVSFRSDRLRTRWGRRIPYLIWSTPFVGLFLVLIGCYGSLTNFIVGNSDHLAVFGMILSRSTVAVIVLGAMMVGWDFANVFVSTIYYYLFNDVVPTAYLSRFFSLFRIVGAAAGMAYNTWVFPHSETHFRMIFVVAGIAYVVGFMLMCFFIREGQYPPPPKNIDGQQGFVSSIKTYARECFTHRLYWWFFLSTTFVFGARLSGMLFLSIRNTSSLGLTRAELGRYGNWLIFLGLLLQFPAGWLSDRWHPLRVYLIASIWMTLGTAAQCVWIFRDFGHHGNLVYMYVIGLSFMPLALIAEAAELPMYMRLLPRERYGQFASANAVVRAFSRILLSVLCGVFIGSMAPWFGERRYTWLAAWQLLFQLIAIVFLALLYRQWKLHGGNENYVPPGTKQA